MKDKILPQNEHRLERAIRILVGVVLLSLIFVGPRTLWGLVGLVPLATGIIGSCPLYTLLGISTCKVRQKTETGTSSAT
jgi:hypothetical protein